MPDFEMRRTLRSNVAPLSEHHPGAHRSSQPADATGCLPVVIFHAIVFIMRGFELLEISHRPVFLMESGTMILASLELNNSAQ